METQAEREKKMTWKEIRDESIGRIKETYDAVTSGYIEKKIQEERYEICEGPGGQVHSEAVVFSLSLGSLIPAG